ncbi:MAG: efflux RND transporter periplasmic adaptor subunit [Luteitalea sp.]
MRPAAWRRTVGVAAILLVALGTWWAMARGAGDAAAETVEVTRGAFLDRATIRGEIKALRSVALTAPSDAGDLRILEMASNGAAVRKGDPVVAFDASILSQKLQEKQSELRASHAEIAKADAEGRLKLEEFTTGRVTAEFDVERSRLDVKAGELSSRFDEQKARLDLSDKQQKLQETDQVLDSGRAATSATVRGLEGKLERAQAEVGRSSRGLAALVIRAPSDGVMVVADNWRAGQFGQGTRPFQVGDTAWPGAQIGELPDLTSARMTATVDEVDRSRLSVGQEAILRVDALSDVDLPARIVAIGTLAKTDISSGWPPKRGFEVVLELARSESRLRPGMGAVARVAVAKHEAQVLVPSRALFAFAGRTVAYVSTRRGHERREVTVAYRNDETTAVAKGLQPGERVLLAPPAGMDAADVATAAGAR